jgi:hypothetical protein
MHYEFKNEVNTFNMTLQKDLILDGIAQTEFWFNMEEQNRILKKVSSVNFFELPDTFRYDYDLDSVLVFTSPNPGEQFLRIQYQQHDKIIYWFYPLPKEENIQLLLELRDFIIEIIESKPEYKALPEARGAYI